MQTLAMKTNRAHRFGLALSALLVAGSALALGSQVREATDDRPCDPCDVNCDGAVDAFDIEPFLDLLFDPSAVACSPCAGDVDGDGVFDAFDTEHSWACLFGDPPPVSGVRPGFRIFFDESGNAGSNAAPHPGSGTPSYGNSSLLTGGGRLYIYGEFQAAPVVSAFARTPRSAPSRWLPQRTKHRRYSCGLCLPA